MSFSIWAFKLEVWNSCHPLKVGLGVWQCFMLKRIQSKEQYQKFIVRVETGSICMLLPYCCQLSSYICCLVLDLWAVTLPFVLFSSEKKKLRLTRKNNAIFINSCRKQELDTAEDMAKHHPDLIMCRKQPGIAIGRVCDKCDGTLRCLWRDRDFWCLLLQRVYAAGER